MARSTVMYILGIVMVLGAAAAMVWTSLDAAPLTVIAIIGIVSIGVAAGDRRSHKS